MYWIIIGVVSVMLLAFAVTMARAFYKAISQKEFRDKTF